MVGALGSSFESFTLAPPSSPSSSTFVEMALLVASEEEVSSSSGEVSSSLLEASLQVVAKLAATAVGACNSEVLKSIALLSSELSKVRESVATSEKGWRRRHRDTLELVEDLRNVVSQQRTQLALMSPPAPRKKAADAATQTDLQWIEHLRTAVAAEKAVSDASRRELTKAMKRARDDTEHARAQLEKSQAKVTSLEFVIDHLEASLQHKDDMIRSLLVNGDTNEGRGD